MELIRKAISKLTSVCVYIYIYIQLTNMSRKLITKSNKKTTRIYN